MMVEIVPPQQEGESWTVTFDWRSKNLGRAIQSRAYKTLKSGKPQMVVPFGGKTAPGIVGKLRFVVSAWNG
jgi:hypothetical protein